jgi:hypothetical protein
MKQIVIAFVMIAVLGGCGVAENSTGDAAESQPSPTASTQPSALSAPPADTPAAAASPVLASEEPLIQGGPQGQPIGRAAVQALVKQDLAAYLGVPLDAIGVQSIEARTWPDSGLGCGARTGVREQVPTAGFLIVLTHGDDTYPYHTDQQTSFVRCVPATKPTGPITR